MMKKDFKRDRNGMYRYVILIAAIGMQTCLGATYAWSVYVQPIRAMTGMLQGSAQLPFALFYFVFPATMIASGSLLERLGPRRCAVGGGLLFGGGWMLAGLGGKHFAWTVTGVGAIAGIGAGLAYIVPIATCIRWFPSRKGLVTGLAVAGFGGGAAVISQVAGFLMTHRGATPFEALSLFGAVFIMIVCAAGWVMKNPADTKKRAPRHLPVSVVLGSPRFRRLYFAMFSGLAAGFAINANLKEIYSGAGIHAGVLAVSLFALANAAGRIAWGIFSDRTGTSTAVTVNLVCQATTLLLGIGLLRSETGLYVTALMTGFNYGGVLVVYAAATARHWGQAAMGRIYGWLFSANIPAAVAPILSGYVYDGTGSFNLALAVIAALLIAAAWQIKDRAARTHLSEPLGKKPS